MVQAASLIVKDGTTTTHLRIGQTFSCHDRLLSCAEISPPLKIGPSSVKILHFHILNFMKNKIRFERLYTCKLEQNTAYTINIINPIPTAVPDSLNGGLVSHFCNVKLQLFLKLNEQISFLESIQSTCKDAPEAILTLLHRKNYRFRNLVVKPVQFPNKVPEDSPMLRNFFPDFRNAKQLMVVILEPQSGLVVRYEDLEMPVAKLPIVPRVLCQLASARLNAETDLKKKSFLRRFLAASTNCGVLVDLIDGLKLPIGGQEGFLTSNDFDRILIDWDAASKYPYAKENFNLASLGFSRLRKNANEHTLASQCWTPALNAAFLRPSISNNLVPVSEWNTNDLLQGFNERKVDYAVLVDCLPPPPPPSAGVVKHPLCPLLLAEYGTEVVPQDFHHKDFSKMACMTSVICVRLAYDLAKLKKKPELVRVFGLLVGGTKAQLLVAQPVVVLEGRKYRIYASISFDPSWKFDLEPSKKPKVQVSSSSPPISHFMQAKPTSEFINWIRLEADSKQISELVFDAEEEEEEQEDRPVVDEAQQTFLDAPNNPFLLQPSKIKYEHPINQELFSEITCVSDLVDDVAKKICSNDGSSLDDSGRLFANAPTSGFLPPATKDIIKGTPFPKQISPQSNDQINLPSSALRRLKPACSLFPAFFPRIYSATLINPNPETFRCTIESLEALKNDAHYYHSFFARQGAEKLVQDCGKFLLDGLYGIHLMQQYLKIINTAISPSTIRFSPIDGVWKFVEFSQALGIDHCTTVRRIIPEDEDDDSYIPPEVFETGHFNPSSDLWSLGKIMQDYLVPNLTEAAYALYEGPNTEKVEECCDVILNVVFQMIRNSPAERIGVLDAIKSIYSVLERMGGFSGDGDLVIQGVRALLCFDQIGLEAEMEQMSIEESKSATESMQTEEALKGKLPLEQELREPFGPPQPGIQQD